MVVASERREIRLFEDNGSKVAFIDILFDDCYGLRGLPKSVQRILDIGAHAGLFSLAARSRFPNADGLASAYNNELLMKRSIRFVMAWSNGPAQWVKRRCALHPSKAYRPKTSSLSMAITLSRGYGRTGSYGVLL